MRVIIYGLTMDFFIEISEWLLRQIPVRLPRQIINDRYSLKDGTVM